MAQMNGNRGGGNRGGGNKGGGNKGNEKTVSKPSLHDVLKNSLGSDDCESDLSFDLDNMANTSPDLKKLKASFEHQMEVMKKELQVSFKHELELMKTELKATVDTFTNVIKTKDETIGNLQKEIGELKKSYDFLSDETSVLKGEIKLNETKIQQNKKRNEEISEKNVDLEDRSRRNNLVFFNFAEASKNQTEKENCEKIVTDLLESRHFFDSDYQIYIDRAHRLGKRNLEDNRPRPIIVRFTYFKDKQHIIMNRGKLKGLDIRVSEDFSKTTVQIHKQLGVHALNAKSIYDDQYKAIIRYTIQYRRVVLTYTTDKKNENARTFTRSFSLKHIEDNKKWYIPPDKPSANHMY